MLKQIYDQNNNQNLDTTEKLAILSDVLQLFNTYLNIKQSNNDDIMNELRKQDDTYFNEVIERLSKIENKLNDLEALVKNPSCL